MIKVKERLSELKKKSLKELLKEEGESKSKIAKLRSDLILNKVKDKKSLRKSQKDLARILTIINEKIYEPAVSQPVQKVQK